MARNVTDGAENAPPKRGRGRPKGSGTKGKPPATPAAAADAKAKAAADADAKAKEKLDAWAAGKADAEKPDEAKSAPGLGHNRVTEGEFLRIASAVMQFEEGPLQRAKDQLKEARGQYRDLRQGFKDRVVLKELDEAIKDFRTERVDLIAQEERRRLYREFMGLPTGTQAEIQFADAGPSEERSKALWWHRGDQAGRLGRSRDIPDGCPPDRIQDFLKGWESGQVALMKESPLTAGAFTPPGQAEGQAAAAPDPQTPEPEAPASADKVLVLGPSDFVAGTELVDACKRTLYVKRIEAWEAADQVVAVFAGKKRVLKDKEEGFEDTGEPDSETSDPEPASEEEAAAVAGEAEPANDEAAPEASGDTAAEDEKGAAEAEAEAGAEGGEEFA